MATKKTTTSRSATGRKSTVTPAAKKRSPSYRATGR